MDVNLYCEDCYMITITS